MVRIEKLALAHNISNEKPLTLIDFLLDNHLSGDYEFFSEVKNLPPTTIKADIIAILLKNNISVGSLFDTQGINIKDLLESDNYKDLIIEIHNNHLKFYNISDLISLSNRNRIIITDIEEGFCYRTVWKNTEGKEITDTFQMFLQHSGINNNNIIALSSNFQNNNFCKEIKLYGMWVLLTVLSTKFSIDLIENASKKEEYKNILCTKEYEKFAVFKNWRPRKSRIILLSLLNKSKLLDNLIDWSLIGDTDPIRYKDTNAKFKQKQKKWMRTHTYRAEIDNFFRKHSLPKFLDADNTGNQWINLSADDCKKYAYSIVVESSPQITEKTVKNFLLGYIPIVIYPYTNSLYIKQIKELGFYILDEKFDNHASIDSVINTAYSTITDLLLTPTKNNNEHLIKNLHLCTDKQILCDYICQPFIDALN